MPLQIAFVDTRLSDWQMLVAGLDPSVEVILLDAERDGVLQIAEALEGRSGVDAIHVLSHGAGGTLFLGSSVLTADNLDDHSSSLATIGQALRETGDLLLYGCNVAEAEAGQSFIEALAQYTQADVAASTDLTGSTSLGGDWVLEANAGAIETVVLSATQTNYAALLAAPYITPAGTLDSTFDGDGMTTTAIARTTLTSPGADDARSVVIQADGRIVVAGSSIVGTANNDFALVRYNADGTLDATFDGDGKVTTAIGTDTDQANSVAVQADGKIVVAGYSNNGSNHDFALARHNADGSLDTTFDGDGKVTTAIGMFSDYAYSLALQADGKIVAAGQFFDSVTVRQVALARYNADGSLDSTFDGDGKVTTAIGTDTDSANSVVVQADGRIVVAGSSYNGTGNYFALAR